MTATDSYLVSRHYADFTEVKVVTSDVSTIEINGTTPVVDVYISTKESPLSELADNIWKPELVFDSAGKTFTRNKGSWIADGFRIGHLVVVTGTASNNSTFTVTAVSELVLTVSEVVADETVNEGNSVVMVGSIPDTEWTLTHDNYAGGLIIFEYGPTAFRLVKVSGTCNATIKS